MSFTSNNSKAIINYVPQSVTYGSGSFSGTEYTDTVTIGSLTIAGQGVGVASRSSGFSGVDGILGYVGQTM